MSMTHGIVDSSSIAAAIELDQTKHIFFQDINGEIRQAVQSTSTGDWDVSADNIVVSDARSSTPLAAFVEFNGNEVCGSNLIHQSLS